MIMLSQQFSGINAVSVAIRFEKRSRRHNAGIFRSSAGHVFLHENLRNGPDEHRRRQIRHARHGHVERDNDVDLAVLGRTLRP